MTTLMDAGVRMFSTSTDIMWPPENGNVFYLSLTPPSHHPTPNKKTMRQVTSSNRDYCISVLAEDSHPAAHFQLCTPQSNKYLYYPSPTTPGTQLSLEGLPPLPHGVLKAMTRQMQDAQSDFQPHTVRLSGSEAAGPTGPEKRRGPAEAGRRGRPSGTTRSAGYRTSTGRPLGTTRAAGFKTSPGRPLGTTRAAGYKVSPGRPPGSIKGVSQSKKLDLNNCHITKSLEFTCCDVPPFPYKVTEKRPFSEPNSRVDETR